MQTFKHYGFDFIRGYFYGLAGFVELIQSQIPTRILHSWWVVRFVQILVYVQ